MLLLCTCYCPVFGNVNVDENDYSRGFLVRPLTVVEHAGPKYTEPQKKKRRNLNNSIRYGKQSIYSFSLNY